MAVLPTYNIKVNLQSFFAVYFNDFLSTGVERSSTTAEIPTGNISTIGNSRVAAGNGSANFGFC